MNPNRWPGRSGGGVDTTRFRAPVDAVYVTHGSVPGLTAERALANDAVIPWDTSVANQVGLGIFAASEATAGVAQFADQAEVEAIASGSVFVPAGRAIFHPGMTKAFSHFNSAGTQLSSINVSSITDSGVGDWTVNYAITFSGSGSVSFCNSGAAAVHTNVDCNTTHGATSHHINCFRWHSTSPGLGIDPTSPDACFFTVLGDV